MVDVMLVLLIVFMVAAPLMVVGVPVQLPKTSAERVAAAQGAVIVSVDAAGRCSCARGAGRRRRCSAQRLASSPPPTGEAPVYVRGDRAVPYGDVMRLMGVVSRAGFAKVLLLAEAASTTSVRAR